MTKQQYRDELNKKRMEFDDMTINILGIQIPITRIQHQETIDIDYEEVKEDEPKQLPESYEN